MASERPEPGRIVAVVGGGLSGSLFALKMIRARPDFRVVLIERNRRLGRGLAYGACSPRHLLNVPVLRMEVGLTPGFADWLRGDAGRIAAMAPALAESGGDLESAFAPRALFGDYLETRVAETLTMGDGPGLAAARGEAVGVDPAGALAVRLADGRRIAADIVVLATGNMPPGAPDGPGGWLYDTSLYTPDPWATDAFEDLAPDASVLLLGAGLTTVDMALKLSDLGHSGPILALSRRGLTPRVHAAGGAWPSFLERELPASPRRILRLIREQVVLAGAQGVPWQRVFDAARPAVAATWRGWSLRQKRQFLRHLRSRWDVHRHRMAPRIAEAFEAMVADGRLTTVAARVTGYERMAAADGPRVVVTYAERSGRTGRFEAARVINCTGPRRGIERTGVPLLADLRDKGLASPDALGLGVETEDGALIDGAGRPSARLYAVGPLTCPSWWEIVAVPEISVQVDRLVERLARDDARTTFAHPLEVGDFIDLGAGI